MKTILLNVLRYAVIGGAGAACIYALILARASYLFHQDTAVSVAAAVRLQPHNAEYLDRLASWQPDDRKALLERSVAEDRFNYNAWIRLGLLAEMQDGDNAAAERDYLEAANVNHMFLPRWTLANFYFRQQRTDDFFHWTKLTLAVTPYASDPVFAQMRQMTQDEETIEAAIPDLPRILLQYSWYLANNKQYDRIPRAVERLVHLVKKEDAGKWGRDDLLAAGEDHMLAAGHLQAALDVWSTLKNAGWIEQSVPSEQSPLTNGDFRLPFYRHGFDWVASDNPGTRVDQLLEAPGLRINLYGDEAEKMLIMQQYVAVRPGAHYSMTWQPQYEELYEPSGFSWHLHSIGGQAPDLVSGDVIAANPVWDFVAPSNAKSFLLTLEYARVLGTVRGRGSLLLKSVNMTQR
jgi:tetratricopeptide (TPR) repeat protein